MSPGRRLAGVALATLAVGAASLWFLSSRDPAVPAVPTMRLERRPFRHEVAADGVLKARQATAIQAPSETGRPMRVAWLVADGTRVRAGDLLARFDETEWTQALADARGSLAGAAWRLARQQTTAEQNERDLAQEAELARRELEAAMRFPSTDEWVFSRQQRIESAIDAELAAERERNAQRVLATEGRLVLSDGRLITLDREKAELEIARAEKGLASLTVTAPHDGLFSLRADWRGNMTRQGDTLWPGQPFAEIPDLAALDAEVWVLEADAGGLAVGQKAKVVLDAAPGETLEAVVERLDAIAKPRQRNVPVQYFGATLALSRTDPERMRPGERLRARLLVAELAEALAVPRQALFEREGKKVVYRRAGDSFTAVAVELGAQGLGLTVVATGLAAGDEIALGDPGAEAGHPETGESHGAGERAHAASGGRGAAPLGGGG